MTEELETAVCAAMSELAEPPRDPTAAKYFRFGFLCGYTHRQDIEIAQLDEKLERLK